jgi:hypothetical protein
MDEVARERFSMLTILHATCMTALEKLSAGGSDTRVVADLKRLLEATSRELEALARLTEARRGA